MNQTYKIYREGNYIRVIDAQTNQLFNGATKEVFVDKNNAQKDIYTILNIKGFSKLIVAIPNILKSDGSAYSKVEWETFYTENTGNFNGGGAAPEISENNVYLSHEFMTTASNENFFLSVVNSGSMIGSIATINNPGVQRILSSTTANSGVGVRSNSALFRLKGNEIFTYIFNPLTFTNTTSRLGIHDSTSSSIPANGVYFEYSLNGYLKIVTEDNNVVTSTTFATLSINTWYKVKFTVNSNATSVLAELFDASGVLISSVTQTTNIPNTTRALNICAITTNSGTTATALIDVDYIGTKLTLTR